MKTEQTVNTEHAGEEIKAPRPRRTKNYRPGRNNRSYGNEIRTGKEEKSEKEEKAVKPQAAEGQRINRSRRPVGRGKRAAAAKSRAGEAQEKEEKYDSGKLCSSSGGCSRTGTIFCLSDSAQFL